ncbi:hypothetical protein [uncultured Fibrobacter sp.]|uniref:hypothetical protein n=1 Tax=uncultured Fibrobacter sp. TaxID=261512 RepID=UPI00263801A9|nr:hypothetical protein [uncultured Fibrobacter sp.]
MNFKALIAAGALLATQSFAIIGIGGHYAPGFGTKLKGMDAPAPVTESGDVLLQHQDFSGTMQGFGFKLWVDILPIIDIEATVNFQFGSYDASLFVTNPVDASVTEIPLEIELGGTPFGKANPKFVAMNGDLSITYPITFLPIIRPYIGGGLTYFMNSFVLNQKFVSSLVDDATLAMIQDLASIDPSSVDPEMVAQAKEKADQLGESMKQKVQDAALDEGLNTSIGGHILVGLRAKLPIIPIAAYTNFKYYIGGDYPSEVDSGNMTLEVGVGLAI